MTKLGEASRFAILEECSREEDRLDSIEALRRKIQSLLGPSNLTGVAHEKKSNKIIKGKSGLAQPIGPVHQGNVSKEKAQSQEIIKQKDRNSYSPGLP